MTPWISRGLLVSIKKKNGLYKKLIKKQLPLVNYNTKPIKTN